MSNNFADRLTFAIKEKGTPTCVGIDPLYEHLPAEISENAELNDPTDSEVAADAVGEFCRQIIKIVAPIVPAVKINIAFFERYYWDGLETYFDLVQEARSLGLVVIGDVKRADIGHTSAMYADAHLADPALSNMSGMQAPDAVTVNPYFGLDGVKPFIDIARRDGKGVFVLVQTSNESAAALQGAKLEGAMTVADHVARMVDEWSGDDGLVGGSGYSAVGAVVSPRDTESTVRLRTLLPKSIFLVPGFGAQGRSAADVAPCFKSDGTGALITASRSVIYAYEQMEYIEKYSSEWRKCVEHACKDFVASVAEVVKT